MKRDTKFKIAAASAVLALLAACGGGGGGGGGNAAVPGAPEEPKFNNAVWSSPGVFVPAGQTDTKLALEGCSFNEAKLTNAHLVIASNGDMSITGSTAQGASATTLFEMPFSSGKLTGWAASGTAQSPTFYILAIQVDEAQEPSKLLLATMGEGSGLGFLGEGGSMRLQAGESLGDGESTISCESIQNPVMHAKLGNSRAAENFGTTAGVARFDDAYADGGRIENGKAFWESDGIFGEASDEFRFLRFDLATGELAANGVSLENNATFTPISMSLPLTDNGGTVSGAYAEMTCRNTFMFADSVAKFIFLNYSNTASSKSFNINAFSFGDKLSPNRSFVDCFATERMIIE